MSPSIRFVPADRPDQQLALVERLRAYRRARQPLRRRRAGTRSGRRFCRITERVLRRGDGLCSLAQGWERRPAGRIKRLAGGYGGTFRPDRRSPRKIRPASKS